MSVTRITPWAVNGPAANYGLAASLSGTATNVPAGALIVTSVEAQSTTTPTVSDTAGNTYTVVLGETSSSYVSIWFAYCLSAKANSANVVTWSQSTSALSGAQGAVYTTSSGTWSFDKSVHGLSAFATALSLSISTTGAGVIYGGFGEYYTGPDTWSITGLTAQASQAGSSSGNGTIGCLLADDITSANVSGLSISVTDANATYGGYIAGIAASFVVSSGGTTFNQAVTGSITPTGATSVKVVITMALAASVTVAGTLAKRISTSFSGAIIVSGATAKRTGKALAGAITGAGNLKRSISTTLSGSTTPTGTLSETAVLQKAVSGAITLSTTIATVLIHGGGAAKRAMTQIALFLGIRL